MSASWRPGPRGRRGFVSADDAAAAPPGPAAKEGAPTAEDASAPSAGPVSHFDAATSGDPLSAPPVSGMSESAANVKRTAEYLIASNQGEEFLAIEDAFKDAQVPNPSQSTILPSASSRKGYLSDMTNAAPRGFDNPRPTKSVTELDMSTLKPNYRLVRADNANMTREVLAREMAPSAKLNYFQQGPVLTQMDNPEPKLSYLNRYYPVNSQPEHPRHVYTPRFGNPVTQSSTVVPDQFEFTRPGLTTPIQSGRPEAGVFDNNYAYKVAMRDAASGQYFEVPRGYHIERPRNVVQEDTRADIGGSQSANYELTSFPGAPYRKMHVIPESDERHFARGRPGPWGDDSVPLPPRPGYVPTLPVPSSGPPQLPDTMIKTRENSVHPVMETTRYTASYELGKNAVLHTSSGGDSAGLVPIVETPKAEVDPRPDRTLPDYRYGLGAEDGSRSAALPRPGRETMVDELSAMSDAKMDADATIISQQRTA